MSMGRKDTDLERVVVCQYPLIGKRCFLHWPHDGGGIEFLSSILIKPSLHIDSSRGPNQLSDGGGSF